MKNILTASTSVQNMVVTVFIFYSEWPRHTCNSSNSKARVDMILAPPLFFLFFDMWLITCRNMKMLNEITAIYGITPGAATQWGLIKRVLHNIAFAGLSEMGIHAASNILGSSLAATGLPRPGRGLAPVCLLPERVCRRLNCVDHCHWIWMSSDSSPGLVSRSWPVSAIIRSRGNSISL